MKRGRISSIPTEEKQHRLKCKSNAWLPPQESDNIDTTTTIVGLPDSVLLNIVSFLFSASISKPMSKTMLAFVSTNKCLQTRLRKDVLPLFPIEARLNVFDRAVQYRALKQISTNGFKVKLLAVKLGPRDSRILLEVMRQFLNCSEIECFEMYEFESGIGNYAFTGAFQDMHPISQFIRESQMKFAYSSDYKELIYFLWSKCSKLNTLRMRLHLSQINDNDWLQSTLLAYPSQISKLELIICSSIMVDYDKRGRKPLIANLERLISSCPKLIELKLISPPDVRLRDWNLTIKSNSLRKIDVSCIGYMVFFSKVDCPKLEYFKCVVSYLGIGGNGVRQSPTPLQDFWNHTDLQTPMRVTALEGEFHGMNVPDNCIVDIINQP